MPGQPAAPPPGTGFPARLVLFKESRPGNRPAKYKICRRRRTISGLRAGPYGPVGLRNAPAGAVRRRRRHRQGNFAANCVRGAVLRVRDLPQNFVEGEPQGGNRSLRHRRGRLLPPLQRVEFLDTLSRPGNRPAFLPCIGRRQEKAERPGPNRDRGQKEGAVQKRSKHKEALVLLRRGGKTAKHRKNRKNRPVARRRNAGVLVDAKRRHAANGLFLIDFAAMLPCAHSAKREGHRSPAPMRRPARCRCRRGSG